MFTKINSHACNRALVQILADFLGVKASEAEVDKQSQHFRSQHNLTEEEAFADWLVQNDLTLEEFKQLISEIARSHQLQRWLMTKKSYQQNSKILLDELRLENRYQECADAAASREKIIQENYPNFIEENNDDLAE
ncbi:MAG: hypothetical protein F6K23_39945 [Okeania sp. SIO2C9]|uniref:hypothetical protein n=1 Tax=Okeania sp. SIO2C9 TaxID=2607791 RepID=UPI0013C13E8F|nr:hypothetical protein [Okeania sp. SIO2C9]NEQ78627.1 hypothetical protein [Okeania sp. SIO2C9]